MTRTAGREKPLVHGPSGAANGGAGVNLALQQTPHRRNGFL
jgi:hypothetical protein